ncbi:hypothetical protein QBC34DRAFT_410079 [Podospora aff. communis PSN243]|uniref:Uncharacterized protein n=1 Tax=Podospora aff. communis PSN243 TaxID=3040156 RepID=A0AAV9GH27_9PEZI|nr:hypothetical protein QBC34DRAFT_410079 [Podospora aff. communis PSN243]
MAAQGALCGNPGDTSYSLFLFPTDGGAFKFEEGPEVKKPPEQWYREHCAVEITCRCLNIIHGRRNPNARNAATLIVLELRFFPRKAGRRVTSAEMKFTFRGSNICPRVVNISPDGCFSLAKSTVVWESSKKVEGGGDIGLSTMASLKLLVDYAIITRGETENVARVWGNSVAEISNNPHGHFNSAYWSLTENTSTSSGVPSQLRLAMLVERFEVGTFWCDVKADINKDIRTAVGSFFYSSGPRAVSIPLNPRAVFEGVGDDNAILDGFGRDSLDMVQLNDLAAITLEQRILDEMKVVMLGQPKEDKSQDPTKDVQVAN